MTLSDFVIRRTITMIIILRSKLNNESFFFPIERISRLFLNCKIIKFVYFYTDIIKILYILYVEESLIKI